MCIDEDPVYPLRIHLKARIFANMYLYNTLMHACNKSMSAICTSCSRVNLWRLSENFEDSS